MVFQNKLFNSPSTISLFGKQVWVKTEFQIEVLTLFQNLMENRLSHARGPVYSTEAVCMLTLQSELQP